MTEFITLGEPLVVLASENQDISLDVAEHFSKYLAGAELNVAIGLSRLGHKGIYLSKVGEDSFGNFIIESVKKAEIETTYLTKDKNCSTGFYLKQKVSEGDTKVDYYRKNSAAANLSIAELKALDLSGIKIAHLSGIFPALSETSLKTFQAFNQKLNEADILTIFDPNLRPVLWDNQEKMIRTINDLAKQSQIILPGINEGEILTGSSEPEKIANFYLEQSPLTKIVVVKLGADGAFVKLKNGEQYFVSGFKVAKVVDTVGAGDGFAVGLESALLEGKTLKEAVKRACAVGALAVQSSGDGEGYPTKEELKAFYKEM
ncbi:sugar kinase [Lactococcus lactis subsp. lactis]|uniref:sugar kinase n=1 Tax=Lactococcus lactis TaxID=1358 RepID=UPI00207880A6|nr:sugar kinase [Lactococcus lactis]MDM7533964.1 sugar kinase [Lactococcus lactis]USI62360.1 sugar kinase [Lactococcus lactis subsp. lactis]